MKLELDIQELRLIEAGLELRNAHNINVINGILHIPRHATKSCEEELNKILKIQDKIQKAYKENAEMVIEEKFKLKEYNIPIKTLEENEESFRRFINGFIGIDISETLGFSIPVIIKSK